jgi:hypothetical protein
MGVFKSKIFTFIAGLQPVVVAIVALALLVIGVMLVYPSERSKAFAKDHLPFVVIGSAVALSATVLAKAITSGF